MTTIAQISDVHVRPKGMLYQDTADSNAMLANAIARLNALLPAPDFVVITGDLTDEGRPDEYAMLRELLAPLRHPYAILPGNHDERTALREAFPEHTYLPSSGPLHYTLDIGDITLIALDSTVPGLHHGELDHTSLAWLDTTLAACKDKPALIAMHHPPFATGIPYLDMYGMRDARAFAATIQAHPHVDRVIVGHVHRSMQTRLGNVPVIACPSTVTQIALRTQPDAAPASYFEPPAFMLHRWVKTDLNLIDEREEGGEGGEGGEAPTASLQGVSHLLYIGDFDGPYPFA